MTDSNLWPEKSWRLFQLPILDAREQHLRIGITVLKGAGLGLIWGIIARIWMRLISTDPEFSIAGTTAILIITTLFGTCTGFAFGARRRGWHGWKHYVPRSLVVIFFLPFGIAGGFPLMLTVLIATLSINQSAAVNLWVLAGLALLTYSGTDIHISLAILIVFISGAIIVTLWKWVTRHWHDRSQIKHIDFWLERIFRTLILLLAIFGFGFVARGILHDKPLLPAILYILFYLILLCLLFLALRVGLKPKTRSDIN